MLRISATKATSTCSPTCRGVTLPPLAGGLRGVTFPLLAFPPACAGIPCIRGGGTKGGTKGPFASHFALSFYMRLLIFRSSVYWQSLVSNNPPTIYKLSRCTTRATIFIRPHISRHKYLIRIFGYLFHHLPSHLFLAERFGIAR